MTTSTATQDIKITIRWTGRNFTKAVANAKRFGGRFNPADKTWTIPANEVYGQAVNLAGPEGAAERLASGEVVEHMCFNYGWEVVA